MTCKIRHAHFCEILYSFRCEDVKKLEVKSKNKRKRLRQNQKQLELRIEKLERR